MAVSKGLSSCVIKQTCVRVSFYNYKGGTEEGRNRDRGDIKRHVKERVVKSWWIVPNYRHSQTCRQSRARRQGPCCVLSLR